MEFKMLSTSCSPIVGCGQNSTSFKISNPAETEDKQMVENGELQDLYSTA